MKRSIGSGGRYLIALIALAAFFLALLISESSFVTAGGGQESYRAPARVASGGYRSPGSRRKVQVNDRRRARALEAQGARVIADYGGTVLLEAEGEAVEEAARHDEVEIRDEYNLIMLNAGPIDTTDSEVRGKKREPMGARRLHLVQFAGPIKPEWHDQLVATGARIVSYIPHNSYLVYLAPGSNGRLRQLVSRSPHIQWDGAYEDSYKIHPALRGMEKLDRSGGIRRPGGAAREGDDEKDQARAAAVAASEGALYGVQLFEDKEENAATIALINRLELEPTINQWDVLEYRNFVVRLPADAVDQIAKRPDVVSVAPWISPEKFDERQNQIIAGNLTGNDPIAGGDWHAYLASKGFTQAQFNASNFAVNVTDSGIDNATTLPNHFGLWVAGLQGGTSRIIYNRLEGTPHVGSTLQGCDGHGNINAHIVGGFVPNGAPFNAFPHADALGFRFGLGVAPFVRMGSSVIFDPNVYTNPNLVNLESKAYQDGARISTNSWGANTGGGYNLNSQTFDAIVRDAQPAGSTFPLAGNQEYVVVFAAGNAGSGAQTVGAPGTAKNVITVGAAENVHPFGGADGCGTNDTGANSANDIIGFSSRGPTVDGRRKPEIVAPGTHVTGGVFPETATPPANGDAAPCFDGNGVCGGVGINFFPAGQQWYTASSGTSHSCPAVAGGAALIRQYFINQGESVPSPAMTKAVLMNSARYMNGVGANDNLWSNSQGMGEMNLNSFFDIFATPHLLRDQIAADMFTATGQQRVFAGTIPDNTRPFRVTLAWTDPPGPTSGNAYINNLDLEVTVGGNTYKGNVFTGAFSSTGGAADPRNNAESVLLPAGTTGTFVATIRATNIAGNGVPNVGGALDQDFALVLYNANIVPVPVAQADGATITAESCAPADGVISPGETVTVDFAIKNVGTGPTTNLVATLLPTGGVTAPSGPQNYGMLVPAGPSVSRPFSFTADPALLCGGTLVASLQLQDGANDLGTVTYTFTLGIPGPIQINNYGSGNIVTPIPDLGTVEIPINVPTYGAVSDVNVRVRLNHTFDGDLLISLVHPDGTAVALSNRRGGGGDNFGSGANDCSGNFTVFDDEAGTAISAGSAPFVGSFRPDVALSSLDGKPVNGTWKLRVSDQAGADVGTIFCAQLEIARQLYICCGVPGTPLIQASTPVALTAESCVPGNSAVDPEETVTVNFPLRNNGDGATTNLVATLLPGGGITPVSGPQTYGVVGPLDPLPTSRPFTFVAQGTCGSDVTATLQLQDGATNLGTVTFTIRLGATVLDVGSAANPAAITIPAVGTSGVAGPYPSTINIAGLVGPVSKVTARLNGFSHTFPGDVDVLLVGPAGQTVILMSDVGGGTDAVNANLTFDDAAASGIGATVVSGTFRPTNSGTGDLFPAPAPAAPHGATLGVFNGTNPNGAWRLFVVDDAGADIGSIAGGWELTVTTSRPVCCDSACTLTCPDDVTVNSAPDQCGANVTFPMAGVVGSCGVLSYSPASGSFFPVGTTPVRVTATRADGATSTCTFNVKVVDATPPTLSSSVAVSSLWPVNHNLINVGLAASAADNCSSVGAIEVKVYSDEDDLTNGSGNFSPDAKNIGLGTLRLRSERKGNGEGRVYLIVLKVTDTAGNTAWSCQTVVVPKSQSPASQAEVAAAAAAAKAYCEANHAPPPGFVLVGDGPEVGPNP